MRELGDRLGEATACWNLALALEEQGNLVQAAELMQQYVDYLLQIDHAEVAAAMTRLKEIRQRLADTEREDLKDPDND